MAAQNGIGAANAAMYGNSNNNNVVLSSPGYHSDMQILMDNMERLSGTLQRNRQEWSQVQDGLARVERLQVCVDIMFLVLEPWLTWYCRDEWLGMDIYRLSTAICHVCIVIGYTLIAATSRLSDISQLTI